MQSKTPAGPDVVTKADDSSEVEELLGEDLILDETQSSLRERRVDINKEFASLDQFLSEYVSNISHTGAFIRTRSPWPVGSRLRMKFTILAEDPEILEGIADVVRVSENPRGMGVEFVELSEASRYLIDKVLRWARQRTKSSSGPDQGR